MRFLYPIILIVSLTLASGCLGPSESEVQSADQRHAAGIVLAGSGLPDQAITPPDSLFTTHATWDLMLVSSFDPNEKNGPLGEGDDGPICSVAPIRSKERS